MNNKKIIEQILNFKELVYYSYLDVFFTSELKNTFNEENNRKYLMLKSKHWIFKEVILNMYNYFSLRSLNKKWWRERYEFSILLYYLPYYMREVVINFWKDIAKMTEWIKEYDEHKVKMPYTLELKITSRFEPYQKFLITFLESLLRFRQKYWIQDFDNFIRHYWVVLLIIDTQLKMLYNYMRTNWLQYENHFDLFNAYWVIRDYILKNQFYTVDELNSIHTFVDKELTKEDFDLKNFWRVEDRLKKENWLTWWQVRILQLKEIAFDLLIKNPDK